MPVLPAVPNAIRVAFEGVQANQPWVNILHMVRVGGLMPVGDMNTFAGICGAAFEAQLYPACSNEFGLRQVVATQLDSLTAAQGNASFSGAGALTGGLAPLSTARVVKETIDRRYRGGHPRFYLAGTRLDDVEPTNGRSLTAAAQVASQNAVTNFFDALNVITVDTRTFAVACVHYYSRHALLSSPIVDVVNDFVLDAVLGTQRRRLQR